jgi:hypothetical protein
MTRATLLLAVTLLTAPAWANPNDGPAADGPNDTFDTPESEAEVAAWAELEEELDAELMAPVSVRGGWTKVHYSLTDPNELRDFKTKGFDLIDMHREPALTLGAGSRRTGFLEHQLEFEGDFSCEFEVRVTHNTPSSMLAVVLNKKVSVLWGQQIVKTKSMRPYDRRSATPDQTMFREERVVRFKIARGGDRLIVECNGLVVAQRLFTKKERKTVRFGLAARNMRFVVTGLSIEGKDLKR